jgi:hypothetical protein
MTSIDIPLLLTCPSASRCKGLNAADVSQCIAAFSGLRSPTALDMSRGRTEDKLVWRGSVRDLSWPTTAMFAISSVFTMRRWSYRCRNMLCDFLIKWSGVEIMFEYARCLLPTLFHHGAASSQRCHPLFHSSFSIPW